MVQVTVDRVSKVHFSLRGEAVLALQDVSFRVEDNEFFSILGPSGCGKTTLLNLIAGFEHPSAGIIRVDDEVVTRPSWRRAVVFQAYALFPWYTVAENIAYGLKRKGVPEQGRRTLVQHYVDLVGLRGFEGKYPQELSGGMQPRVSIARALAVNPDVLLMDEPFGALDAQTRNYMQEELLKIWQREPKTVVFVTHSIDEAVRLSDRIMIMSARPGRVQEIKQVVFPRPRDPRDPGVAQLVVEIWDWLRPRVAEEEQASRIGPA